MGLGTLIGKLLGGKEQGSAAESADPVEYKGYTIIAEPMKEGAQYRTAGIISKEIGAERRSARFIRADNHSDLDSAVVHTERKAKQIIDEQGDDMFERDHI